MDLNSPQLNTPKRTEMWALHVIVDIAIEIGEYLGFLVSGRAFAILLGFPVVLISAGLFIMLAGKNPFEKNA